MSGEVYFKPAFFKFLRDLRTNNNRDWFNANKGRYEGQVKDPALRFISDFGTPLAKISKHFSADPRPVGGSMFRIYRDVRFSKNKAPYKTAVGIQFRHKAGKDAHAPGFYLHLEPGEIFAAAGLWRPDSPSLKGIRDAIVADAPRWRRIRNGKALRDGFEFGGDALKRPPKGYDPEHPLVEDLKRKDFICHTKLLQKDVTGADFDRRLAGLYRQTVPLMRFLSEAVGVDF
jgi:uncharacterized protein (TIGR02453 family)